MAIEGLRADLEWLSTLVARVDGETPHPITAWLDVELQRLRAWLGTAPGRDLDSRDESARAGCGRMQAVLLNRRIERELAQSSVHHSADGLWAGGSRSHGSRPRSRRLRPVPLLRTSCRASRPNTILVGPACSRAAARNAEDVLAWLVPLEKFRGEMADEASRRLNALDLSESGRGMSDHRPDGRR